MARGALMWLDYVVFASTIAISVAIGVYQAVKKKNNANALNEYLVASRKLRPFPVGISMSVSFISAIAVLGYSAEIHYYGATYGFYVVGISLGTLIAFGTGLPMLHSLKLLSVNEYLTRRYGSLVVLRLSWFWQICSSSIYAGVVIYGPAVMLETMAGFPVWASMVLLGAAGTLYTTIGGFRAVIWTDCFQALVIFGGMVAVVIQGSIVAGGFDNVWAIYAEGGRLKLDIDPSPMARQTVWGVLVTGVLHGFGSYSFSQVGIQRVSAVGTLSDARSIALWTIPSRLVLELIPCLCGVITFAYFASKQCDPIDAGLIHNSNQILPFFVMETMKYPGVPGLFVACIFAAALSNVSSLVNSSATLTWNDLFSERFHYWSDRKKTLLSKFLTVSFGGIAILIAFVQARIGGTLMQLAILCESSVLTPVFIIFVVGATVPRVNWKSIIVGAIFGWMLSLWLSGGAIFFQTHQERDHKVSTNCARINVVYNISHYWIAPIAAAAGSLVAILVSCIPSFHTNDKDLDVYYPPVRWLLLRFGRDVKYAPAADESTKDTEL